VSGPSVKLTPDELDTALAYVEASGVSDFFPQPFEIAAIRHCWNRVRSVLEKVEMLTYESREVFALIAPKQRCLVRPVHLLDPIDSVLYTALTVTEVSHWFDQCDLKRFDRSGGTRKAHGEQRQERLSGFGSAHRSYDGLWVLLSGTSQLASVKSAAIHGPGLTARQGLLRESTSWGDRL
jgi:hypothetical protein